MSINQRKSARSQTLPPKPHNPIPVWVMATLAALWLIVWDLEISFDALAYGVEDMLEYFSRYGKPDFSNLSIELSITHDITKA